VGSKASFRSLGFLMWIIVLAAFQFLDLRSRGWIVLIAPALIIIVLIAFCMILGIVRWLDAKLSASASARAVRRVSRKRRSIVGADIRARDDGSR
jgi:predicted Na+-dependent transporter